MITPRIAALVLAFLPLAEVRGAEAEPWKYAGEDHGIRFFYKALRRAGEDRMALKLENTLEAPVEVHFRIRDLDWKTNLSHTLPPLAVDSSLVVRPRDKARVSHPYMDQVFILSASAPSEGKAERSLADAHRP